MSPTVTCPNPDCGKSYQVSSEYLGRRGRCKSCGTEFVFAATNSQIGNTGTGSQQGSTRIARTQIPARLGRFQILERVGMGGFGAVYRAQDPQLQRTVALKLLQSTGDEQRDQHRIDRFLVEGRAGARLQHPNIVPVFDAGKDEETGEYYLAAAFISGEPLSARIEGKPLELRQAATIVSQIAQALDYAHRQGILHRDVKPDNVMLDARGVPHLMDFGLARMEESESHLTRDGAVMGTPSYMSPEQCVGKQEALGPAADQYSLGCLFYELLTGDKLFSGPVSVQIHHQINTEPPPPSTKNAAIPKDLDTICLKTLVKEPDRRYASCAAFANDLNRWLADEPIQARQLSTWERWNRWRRRNPAIAGLSLGLAATLLAGLIGVTTQWVRAERHAHLAAQAAQEQERAKEAAEAARRHAEQAAEEERKAKFAADAERQATQKHLAESYVQRGRFLCLQDEVAHGLLWMARGLRTMPPGEPTSEQLIALRIGAWEPRIPRRQVVVRHEKQVAAVCFEPKGTWFATASRDRTSRRWSTETGQPLGPPLQHDAEVAAVAVSDDGQRILTGSADGTARLWSSRDGTPVGEPLRHPGAVTGAVFADGGTIATCARTNEGWLHFWNADTGEPRREPIKLKSHLTSMAVTRDRRTIVVASGGEILTFDSTGQEFGSRIVNHGIEQLRGLTTTPDGAAILATGLRDASRKGIFRLWELSESRKEIRSLTGGPWSAVNCAAYSTDGNWLITGLLNGTAERISSKDFERVGYRWHSNGPIRCVDHHPLLDVAVTGGDDGSAILWSLPPPKSQRLLMRHPGGVYAVTISSDGQKILSGCTDRTARIWDAATGASISQSVAHQSPVIYVALRPDGQTAASGNGSSALLWNTADGTTIGQPYPHPRMVLGVDFSRDGNTLLTGCDDGIARLWDTTTGQVRAQTESHPARVWPVAFSRDGKLFATGCGIDSGQTFGELRVWDAKTCQLVAGPMACPALVTSVCFARNDTWVATACADVAHVWDIQTGKVVRGPFLHPGGAFVAVFDPAERFLVTSAGDGRVRFWDLESQQQFGPDLIHGDMAIGLSFTADGRRLVTGSLDGTVRVWDVPQAATGTPDEIERRIQRATGLRLTERGDLERIEASAWQQLAPAEARDASR